MKKMLFAILAVVVFETPAWAQSHLELTPMTGLFFGARSVLGGGGLWSEGPVTVYTFLKQRLAPVAGFRATLWTSRHFGLELGGAYTSSGLRQGTIKWAQAINAGGASAGTTVMPTIDPTQGGRLSYKAGIAMVTARAVGAIPLYGGAVSLHMVAGVGAIDRLGAAYSTFTSGTLAELYVLGTGARFRLGPSTSLRLDVEDNLSGPRFEGQGGWGENAGVRVQHDFSFTVGMSMRVL